MLNLVNHYNGNHDQCSGTSQCRRDANYEPSKTIITSPVAENILANAIKSLKIYKSPERYVYCRSTYYVECFNNALLIYHNKRIVFGTREYRRRTLMSVVEWNEIIHQFIIVKGLRIQVDKLAIKFQKKRNLHFLYLCGGD